MKALRILFALVFWSWNALFLFLITAGFAPMVMLDLIADAMEGLARWHTVAWSALLFFLPVVVTICAAVRLRKDPVALFIAFFGIEIPAMTLALFRLFGMADLHGAAGVTMASVVVGGFALLAWLMHSASDDVSDGGSDRLMPPVARVLVHAGLSVFAVGSLYLGFVLAFITVPVFIGIVGDMLMALVRSPAVFVAGFFPTLWSAITVLSVFLSPIFTPIAAVRALVRSHRALVDESPFAGSRSRTHVRAAFALTIAPAALLVVVIASGWQQPHKDVLARLAAPPASDAERRAILDDEQNIRAALTDAYLAHHRYVADNGDNTLLNAWRDADLDADDAAAQFHRAIARPFVFDGDTSLAKTRADELYRALFGEEIERTERDAVRAALASKALRDERYAGFMNEGEERVWLAAQHVTVTPASDNEAWAAVEIADTWMNQTGNDEEVLLMFSLPPDAAVTGLWLGSDPDKAKAFTHVVAPRGAAQQVYNEQVRQRRDPALLEQVGPQQYRLRVFPVPRRERTSGRFLGATRGAWHDVDKARPRMHVWLRYETLVDDDGRVPYPRLAERRNGFWDAQTERSFAGTSDADIIALDREWVQAPSVMLGKNTATLRASVDGACWQLAPASPLAPRPLEGRTVDVVVDRSYGMRHHKAAMKEAVQKLGDAGTKLRFVRTSSAFRGEPPSEDFEETLDIDAIVPFGATSPREMIEQRARIHDRRFHARNLDEAFPRAAVIVLAATGSFDTAVDLPIGTPAHAAHYLVHFGGLPAGYDDGTADFLATSGGTAVDARDFDDVIRAIATTQLIARDDNSETGVVVLGRSDAPLVVGGRELTRVDDANGACSGGPTGVLARLAVRALDRGRSKSDAATLDAMHRLAVGASVVTPYSSMIVLVDEEQRRRLAELEKQDDRFQREVEQHKESGAPNVFGAPEPHEWALLALVVAVLAILARRQRGAMNGLAS